MLRPARALPLLAALLVALALAAPAGAFHWYRGPAGGCTPADGALASGPAGPAGASVLVLHNSFNDALTLQPVTIVDAGESVTWTWNSSHCHSIVAGMAGTPSGAFRSGYHYPTQPPESPQVLPGFFEYPVPDLTPTLSFTHTFDAPGTFAYYCEHHWLIGMSGVVVVQ